MAYIKLEDLMAFPIRIDHYDKENGNEHFVYGVETVLEYAENLPVADVAPVVHGRWVLGVVEPGYFTPGGNRPWVCSECGYLASWRLDSPTYSYCPNCGARMDGA